jgi:hypothetical protein
MKIKKYLDLLIGGGFELFPRKLSFGKEDPAAYMIGCDILS